MWHALQVYNTSIIYLAMILKSIQEDNDIAFTNGINDIIMNPVKMMFAIYNGTKVNKDTIRYANDTYSYYLAFREIS